ncbi:hypothetical protein [Streptomyces sp. t39]|uniref:hypothetical protein n=1 Tax=Streptomyces sp. t39 TaxID=1828156 RepID=UPI0011CD7E8E|nr:hypothetical protein [Streptomyces sp. t39]TXS48879.1 hypothetical protein EAO77_30480 [Streptomyces sp. t39]
MGGRLYGQQTLHEDFVPRLVGLHHTGNYQVPFAFPAGAPVVEIVGGRGSGRTALIDAVHDAYNGRVPLARVDLDAPGFGEPGVADLADEDAPNASHLTQLLYVLAYRLGLDVRHFGRALAFPRLSLGLLVVSAWRPLNADERDVRPPDLRRAEADLRTLVTAEDADPRRRRESLGRWFDLVTDNLPQVLSAVPGLDSLAGIVLDAARQQLLRSEPDKGALAWWGARLHGSQGYQGDPLQRLFQFVRVFRRLDDRRRTAEEHLVAALLDDIDGNYGRLRRLNRKPRPLLLVDNAHTATGRAFLALLEQGAGGPRPGPVTRPVVLATLLGRGAPHPPLTDAAGAVPAAGSLVLRIPDVEPAHIAEMLSPVDYPDHLPRLVARYSGGRAASARTLADTAVRRVRETGNLDTADLLDAAAPELLAKLLPDPVMRERLVLLSAAADAATRRGLWTFAHPEDHSADLVAARVRETDDHRRASCLDGDRALDLVLRHRFAATATHERWRDTQLRLRSLCDPRGDTYLHHTLALGRTEEVVCALHHRFTGAAPAQWLTTLNTVCSAPRPRPGYRPPAPAAPLSCTACGSDRPSPQHEAVASLVPLLWRLSDPLTLAPREDELTTVRIALETLYGNRAAHAAYREASAAWPARLRAGVQAPGLPVPEGDPS